MMPRDITPTDLAYYRELNPTVVVYAADNETVYPVRAIVTKDHDDGFNIAVRVPWTLDEIELANLAQGGTLWLTCFTGLPPHSLHVQPPHKATT